MAHAAAETVLAILKKNEWPESVGIKLLKDKESKIKINKKFKKNYEKSKTLFFKNYERKRIHKTRWKKYY